MTQAADFFRFVPHPEVWVLVLGLAGLYVYAAKVIGPKVVPAGTPAVTPSQWRWFALGIVLLWGATDWPVHDIGERYLYMVHMSQHTVLTFLVPPVLLMATPQWLARLVLGSGRVDHWVHKLARPVPAALLFNALALLTHWQIIVNSSSENGLFHYGMHTAMVLSAFLLWIPVCGPLPELRIPMPAQMLYLFITSIVPTVPSGWLIFAEGAVYSVYDIPDRLWGISVTTDQQIAGAIMKLGAGTYLWVIIAVIFFIWSSRHADAHRNGVVPSERDVLTWEQVRSELDRLPPGPEEARTKQ